MAISKIIYKQNAQDTGTVWMDATPATAAAADITAPKTAMLADGVMTTGTGSGGGGGLEYETGTYTPTNDIARPTINFTNTHATRPFSIVISDVTESDPVANSMIYWTVTSWYDAFNSVARGTNSSQVYGGIRWAYSTSSSYSANGTNIQYLTGGSTQTYMDYVMTSSSFYPYGNSSSYNWRSGRTYKWIAVWAPTT